MNANAIAVSGLHKAYAAQTVLSGIDFSMPAGQTVGLVGVNGAGKTTLIRCLLDFCPVDAGEIRLFGRGHRERDARASLGYLPERFQPPWYATGEEFIRHVTGLHGQAVDQATLAAAAADLDLAPAALARPVRTLSKGMAQKIGLLAVLLAGRELLVLDEPMSGLDPLARALVKAKLAERHAAGVSILLCTHLLADVEDLCDRLLVLHGGRLVFDGSVTAFAASRPGDTLEQVYLHWVQAGAEPPRPAAPQG